MSKHKKALNQSMGQSASTQLQNPTYPQPTVPMALGGFLSPKQVTAAGLEVVVTYPSIKQGDVIALKFNGDDTLVPIEAENQKSVSFRVSVSHIIKALGTTVEIQYTLGGESAGQRSDILQLTVLPFMEGDLQMAKITEASPPTPGVLDLATFTGDAEVKVEPWPLIEAGQTVWLDLEYDGQAGAIPIIAGEKITASEVGTGITRSILRTDLEKATHKSLIKLPLKVDLSDAATIPFPTLELEVRQSDGGEDIEIVEDFAHYEPGRRTSPFTTEKNIVIDGSSLAIIAEAENYLIGDARPRKATTITLNGAFRRVSIELSAGGYPLTLTCIYQEGLREQVTVPINTLLTYDFVHVDITSLEILGHNADYISSLNIRKIKLYT